MNLFLDARTGTHHFPGIRRYVLGLAHGLTLTETETGLSLICPSPLDEDESAFQTPRCFPCLASPFSLRQQWTVPRILKNGGASLYHSPYYLMPYKPGVATVLTCHDVIPLIYPEYFTLWQRLIYRMTNILALKTASAVIAVSESTRQDLIRYFCVDPARVTTVLSAVEGRFAPRPLDHISRARRKYGLPERYVLYVGINKPHKNLYRLIKAWEILWAGSDTAGCKLVVAGYWDNRYPEARELAAQSDLNQEIIFSGPIEEQDLPSIYSGATLFVFPSLYEGFGFPVLEAMACGTAVACGKTSSLLEVAGEAASFFDPMDPSAMADHLRELLSHTDLLESMREAGLRQASRFAWKKTAAETLEVYRKVLS